MFGGTFDPPHLGHRSVAADVADHLNLTEVVWIPAGDPPHKRRRNLTPADLRLRMVRAATADDPRFRVSEIEIHRDGPSYTVDTLRALKDEHDGWELYLILGIDQYRTFHRWRKPEEIVGLATLAVMDREGEALALGVAEASGTLVAPRPSPTSGTPGTGGNVLSVPVGRVDISSTQVRAAVSRGESIVALVPAEVAEIIEAEGLYRRDGERGRHR